MQLWAAQPPCQRRPLQHANCAGRPHRLYFYLSSPARSQQNAHLLLSGSLLTEVDPGFGTD
jgi:hypothetical protein